MEKFIKTLTALSVLLFSLTFVYAQSLQEAKDQGLIGEQTDGYIGLVADNAPAAVRALVEQVNEQRRQEYQRIANENGIELNQVARLAYERAVQATQSGHYIQNSGGRWVRK